MPRNEYHQDLCNAECALAGGFGCRFSLEAEPNSCLAHRSAVSTIGCDAALGRGAQCITNNIFYVYANIKIRTLYGYSDTLQLDSQSLPDLKQAEILEI